MLITKLNSWIKLCALASRCKVKQINFSESKEWIYSKSIIRHQSGRFFKIIGLEWMENKIMKHQLFIDQREIGILGFLLYKNKNSNYILVQGKVEPGNIQLAQISPTCQATNSNIKQIHGGTKPEFVNYFKDKKYQKISSSLQSEQGDRFYGKRNKNIIVSIDKKISHSSSFVWIDVDTFLQALGQDFLVNTDARSVVVCSNWVDLVGSKLFNEKDFFTKDLRTSYCNRKKIISLKSVLNEIKKNNNISQKIRIIPIKDLTEYNFSNKNIAAKDNKSVKLIHIRVKTNSREVPCWDQPIITSQKNHEYTIYCGRWKNVLYFLFTFWTQPGLYNKTELGPIENDSKRQGKLIRTTWQSEEGGRFFKDINKYNLIDIGEIGLIRAGEIWLSLYQVQKLCCTSGIFTNEARSNISLILAKNVK